MMLSSYTIGAMRCRQWSVHSSILSDNILSYLLLISPSWHLMVLTPGSYFFQKTLSSSQTLRLMPSRSGISFLPIKFHALHVFSSFQNSRQEIYCSISLVAANQILSVADPNFNQINRSFNQHMKLSCCFTYIYS